MKNILIISVFLFFVKITAQNFGCNDIDRYQLNYIYKQNENKFKLVINNINYTETAVESFSIGAMKQICINNWGVYQQNGKDYMYKRFVDNNGYLDKNYYLINIGYLEILSYLKYQISAKVK